MRDARTRLTATAGALALSLAVAACTGGTPRPGTEPSVPPSTPAGTAAPSGPPVDLVLGVHGPDDLVAAYEEVAAAWEDARPGVRVEVRASPDREAALDELARAEAAGRAPDVFLAERVDLPLLMEQGWIQPVDELLGARGVDFGDGYQREGMTAFSADLGLQCMPHDVSPMVVYLNTDLVDLDALADEDGEGAPNATDGWTFEQFAAAARSASGRGVDGLAVEPTLEHLAPFVLSAGGGVVDDAEEPTSLSLSDEDLREPLAEVLDLLRDPRVTPDAAALARRGAVERFETGRAAMVLGYRDLVPRFRGAEGLSFDVMPAPRVGAYRTVGRMSGFCLSAATDHVDEAADLLTYVVGDGERVVARSGWTLPANLSVAYSADFAQGAQDPPSSFVFNEGVRRAELLPPGPGVARAEELVAPQLRRLLFAPVLDLERLLTRIDRRSQPAFRTDLDGSELDTPEAPED